MAQKKVYITRSIPEIGIKMLKSKGYEVDVNEKEKVPTKKDIIRALKKKEYDAVLTLLTDPVDTEVFNAAPTVRIYANYAVGYNNIDLAEAHKRGIFVTNTPGGFSDCIAEHTMALMLALTTRIVEADAYVKKGKYKGWSPLNFIGTDLRGKVLGLLGAGHIGERVAHHAARGFDMKIVYHDLRRNEKIEQEYGAEFKNSVDDVCAIADIVSLHVPLLPQTHHLINKERLSLMKPTAYLINTSRGPVVDEKALVKALLTGQLRGAGLDVYEFEPKLTKGLSKLSNVVLTPHIASARESARNEMATLAAQNIIDCLEERIPQNLVSAEEKL